MNRKLILSLNFVFLFFVSSLSYSEEAPLFFRTPDYSQLTLKPEAKVIQGLFYENKKLAFSVRTIPADKTPSAKVKLEKDHLYFDTRTQEADGYRNVQIKYHGLDPAKMADQEFCLYIVVQGPKGGKGTFYYEWQSKTGKRYHKSLHVPRFFDAYLTVFDKRGLEFMGTINQDNVDIDLPYVTRNGIKTGAYYDSPFTIHSTGTPHPGGWHGTPPIFNPLHPDVQKMTLRYFDEIISIGAKHPSFKGIIFHLSRHALHSFGDIQAGYNDYMIKDFEKETGITIDVDKSDPKRGKFYYDWLMKNAKDQWIDWRCKKLSDWYKVLAEKLRKARPDLKLGINARRTIIYERNAMYSDDQKDYWDAVNREMGIDAKYYKDTPNLFIDQTLFPADYRFMEGRKEEIRNNLRKTEERPGMYESLAPADSPWINMHDRYWEFELGDQSRSNSFLQAPWLKEHTWRVSTLNPAGFYAMRHYIMPLRYKDILGYSKGGFLIGTHGMEDHLVPFAAAFRALPAVPFKEVAGSTDMVRIRTFQKENSVWFYVANTLEKPVRVEIGLNASSVTDLGRNFKASVHNNKMGITLKPYELRSFSAETADHISAKVIEK